MTPEEEQLFDSRFTMDYDNGPESGGPQWLFRVNPDGTSSIALATDVKDFINELLDRRKASVINAFFSSIPSTTAVPLPITFMEHRSAARGKANG